MLKKSLIALSTVAVIAVGALPAFAATDDVFYVPQGTSVGVNQLDDAKANVAAQLNQQGIKATDVDQWGGYVRADVTLPNGTHAVRFFEPGTLAPVNINDLH